MFKSIKRAIRLWRIRREVARSHPKERWQHGLDHEAEFWDRWIATHGLTWPDEYRERIAPDTPLQAELATLLQCLPDHELRLLDIGAGPLTVLGKNMLGRKLEITATDALAERYNAMLSHYSVEPPVRTIACPGEDLLGQFPTAHFHLVYAQNSLDHTFDPMAIIRAALRLVRRDGYIILLHHPIEAERVKYEGLHQWNFELQGEEVFLWRPGTRYRLSSELTPDTEIKCGWVGQRIRILIQHTSVPPVQIQNPFSQFLSMHTKSIVGP